MGFRQVALEDNEKNRYLAKVILVNPSLDIALLSAEGDFSRLPEINLAGNEAVLGQKTMSPVIRSGCLSLQQKVLFLHPSN